MAGTISTAPRLGSYPVLLPSWRDARLAQSAVLLTLQVLGQTVLGFNVSVPQILVCLATAALLELAIVARRRRVIMWPASALLTGNGVALLLRHPDTVAGDRMSTAGLGLFAAVAAGSLLSKHLLRWQGRHIFNPSNLGLVVALVLLGAERADLQFLYWGPWRPGLAAAVALIIVGAAVVGRRAGVLAVGVTYLVVLNVAFALLAATDQCIVAAWHELPLCGAAYWWRVALSPETLVFAAFMITDPRTVPSGRWPRLAFAATAAWAGAMFAAPQHTEWATKLAILGGLTAASAALFAVRAVRRFGAPTAAGAPSQRIDVDSFRGGPPGAPSALEPTFNVGAGAAGGSRSVLMGGVSALAVVSLLAVGALSGPASLLAGPVPVSGLAGAPDISSTPDASGAPDAPGTGSASATAGTPAARPLPPLPAWPDGVTPPPVSVDPAVAAWAPWFRPRDAELRARALLVDLEAQRLGRGEAPPTYLRITVLMVKVPESRQDSPEVGLELQTLHADGRDHTDWYRLESQGDSYVIAGTGEPWVD